MKQGLKNIIKMLFEMAFTEMDGMSDSAYDILSSNQNAVWSSCESVARVFSGFCMTIIGICLLIELAQLASKCDLLKWEHGIKAAVKMVLAKVTMDVVPTFLHACYLQAISWVGEVNSLTGASVTSNGASLNDLVSTILDEDVNKLGELVGLLVGVVIVILGIKICGILVKAIAYGRIFEIYVYVAISPVPCAFMPLGTGEGLGINRITSRFLKSFIAVCLQGVMMMVAINVFNTVMLSSSGFITQAITAAQSAGGLSSILDITFVSFLSVITLTVSVAKCGSWAKTIMDAA